jgi:uncharacterized membrane protein YfcA
LDKSLIPVLVFAVAALYGAVGHGGASGYLAALSLFRTLPGEAASSALVLNLLVSALAWTVFFREKRFSWRLTWPFLAGSLPAAFLGGSLEVDPAVWSLLLGLTLVFAAGRLLMKSGPVDSPLRPPSIPAAVPVGAAMGLLSGILGVGGGIFLSPLMILRGWAPPKETAATAAFFIFANSLAGLGARVMRGGFHPAPSMGVLVVAAFLGGLWGARTGARRVPPLWLKRLLAAVLFLAAGKLFLICYHSPLF